MIEITTYRLSHQTQKIGSYLLKSHLRAGKLLAEGSLQLKNFGETSRIWQQSEADATSFSSSNYQEINEGEGFTRQFQFRYDAATAMLYANRKLNGEEEESSSQPALIPYSDSLALLYLVRSMSQHDITSRRVPMLGKDVVIERSQTATSTASTASTASKGRGKLEPAKGLDKKHYRAPLHHYRLCPGNAHIWVSSLAPYPIVKILQPSSQGKIEATLQHYRTRSGYLSRDGVRQRDKRRRRRAKRR